MEVVLDELIRVVAYGGLGMLLGFLVATLVSDRHRIVTEILDEAERDVPTKPRRLPGDVLQTIVVIVLMVMLLLTGVVSLQNSQSLANQTREDCLRASDTSQTLQARTRNYLEKAVDERRLWRSTRGVLIGFGSEPDAPIIVNIDRYLDGLNEYVDHLRENPYKQRAPEDC